MIQLNGIIRAQQFDKKTLDVIFNTTEKMKTHISSNLLKGKIMISFFEEESTRTRFSFEAAMIRLGGSVISTENAKMFSSLAKGENMTRAIKVISGYGDVIVLRQSKKGEMEKLQRFSRVPIINAGDGPGQHPTQALLDLYTILERFRKIEGLNIVLMGDLLNGRTVRSLCYFLAKHYSKNKLFLVSPKQLRMEKDIIEYLAKYKVDFVETTDLSEIIAKADVLYQTRVQRERFDSDDEYDKAMRVGKKLIITKETLGKIKQDAIIMHPMPIKNEITDEVDNDPRAWYFKQADNGLYVRMALLKMILHGY